MLCKYCNSEMNHIEGEYEDYGNDSYEECPKCSFRIFNRNNAEVE